MEIINGVERRWSWPLEQKLVVLAEASHGSQSAGRLRESARSRGCLLGTRAAQVL